MNSARKGESSKSEPGNSRRVPAPALAPNRNPNHNPLPGLSAAASAKAEGQDADQDCPKTAIQKTEMHPDKKIPAHGVARVDWNFDSILEEELHVCCLWEYGRESKFLCSIRERSAEAARLQLSFRERLDFVERDFSKVFSALGRSACLFQEGLYCLGGDKGYPGVISRFPEAWQSLSKSEKSILLETADWDVKKFCDLPGFRRSNVPRADALVKLFQPKSFQEVFGGDGRVGVREYFHAGHKAGAADVSRHEPVGAVAANATRRGHSPANDDGGVRKTLSE
jgi:hypothetical protein